MGKGVNEHGLYGEQLVDQSCWEQCQIRYLKGGPENGKIKLKYNLGPDCIKGWKPVFSNLNFTQIGVLYFFFFLKTFNQEIKHIHRKPLQTTHSLTNYYLCNPAQVKKYLLCPRSPSMSFVLVLKRKHYFDFYSISLQLQLPNMHFQTFQFCLFKKI